MADAPDTPTIPEPARKLSAFLGIWVVSGSITTGDHPAEISGRWRFTSVADGHGVRTAGETSIEGMGTFQEEELIGFDPSDGKLHLFSLNMFAVRDHVGEWQDDRVLLVEYNGDVGGKHCTEQMTIEIDKDRMNAVVVETVDGDVVATTELTLVKES